MTTQCSHWSCSVDRLASMPRSGWAIYPLFFLEVALAYSIAAIMLIIAFVLLSRWYSSMKITKKQFLKTLPIALILPAIPVMLFFLFNPQRLNLTEPVAYAWELIFFYAWVFLVTCRTFLQHFGKKNLETSGKIHME